MKKIKDLLELQPDPINSEKVVGLKVGLGRLSSEAKEVVGVIFNAPAELFEGITPLCLQTSLRKYLRREGMALSQVNNSFKQIKRMLKEL